METNSSLVHAVNGKARNIEIDPFLSFVQILCLKKHLNQFLLLLLLLLITRPLPRDGGMAEDNGAPEAGQLPRVWTRGCRETESRQRVSGAKSP